jgi:hypothetical protein
MPLRYRIVKRSLWLQGLLIVLALSAHDLVMAWDSPVAAMAPTTSVIHQHSSADAVVDMTAEPSNGHPESPQPNVCGIGGTALVPPVDQLGVPDLNVAAATAPSYFPTSAHPRTLLWEEPRWPPGTCRALLQVYRI